MVKFSSWFDIFKRNEELADLTGLDLAQDTSNRAYIKRIAIDTVINFVARTVSQSEFRLMDNDTHIKNEWDYKLNIRPNTDQTSTDFWQKVIYELLFNNEVLIVLSDTDDLLIADSFVRNEYALYEDTFESVVVKQYMFNRKFKMNEVIYLNYNNVELENYIAGLFGDYGELFGRMFDVSLRNNQIRGIIETSGITGTEEQKRNALQGFIDKMFRSFNNPIAIIPVSKGFNYQEISTSGKSQSFTELENIKTTMITEVAKLIGVPPALVHGEMADLDSNRRSFIDFCVNPLIKKIENELNAKLLDKSEVLSGKQFDVVGINKPNFIKDAEKIDKAIMSGFANVNELRKEYGLPPREGGDVYVMTKNYEQTTKGGEEE